MTVTRSVDDVLEDMDVDRGDLDLDLDRDVDDVQDESVEARLRFRVTGGGHVYVTDQSPHTGRERPVYLHRLAAVAWGILEGLGDPREVHHDVPQEWRAEGETVESGLPWLNLESVLEPVQPDEHSRYHINRNDD